MSSSDLSRDLAERLLDLSAIASALASELRDYVADSPALEALASFAAEHAPERTREVELRVADVAGG